MEPTADGTILPHRLVGLEDSDEPTEPSDLRWLVARAINVWSIFPHETGSVDKDFVSYQPLGLHGLHRDFAALATTEKAVKSFADRYGFLGHDTWQVTDGNRDLLGEWVEDWFEHIRGVRLLLRLWDAYRDPDTTDEDFYRLIDHDGDAIAFNPSLFDEEEGEGSASDWLYEDVLLPYPAFDPSRGNQQRYGAGMLLSGIVSNAIGTLALPMVEVRKGGQINLVPKNLLGAIYVLFAQEVMGRAEPLTRCGACGRWFVAKHASRLYCSDACKMKAYRRTKKENS